jgi:D-alanyl-D-alanine carboxypeptidase
MPLPAPRSAFAACLLVLGFALVHCSAERLDIDRPAEGRAACTADACAPRSPRAPREVEAGSALDGGTSGCTGAACDAATQVPLDPELDQAALAWVSKARCLPCDFDAKLMDLTSIDANALIAAAGAFRVRAFVQAPLRALLLAASTLNDRLIVTSGYRSYATQAATLQGWVDEDGPCAATEYSAAPGRSEHQLGVTVDLGSSQHGKLESFVNSPLAAWVREHAYEYGFVMSYPHPEDAQSQAITGYTHEPWHFRYVGPIAAGAIHAEAVARGVPISVEELFTKKYAALVPYAPTTANAPATCVACEPARGQLSGCPSSTAVPLQPTFTCAGKTRVRCVLGLITCDVCANKCVSGPGDDTCS